LEKAAEQELLANDGVSNASRKLLELVREGNKEAREAADRVSTKYEGFHTDIDGDPLGLPCMEEIRKIERHAGYARGEEAMRQIEKDVIERLQREAQDGRRAEGDPKEGGTRAEELHRPDDEAAENGCGPRACMPAVPWPYR